jgi:hypothetical protein
MNMSPNLPSLPRNLLKKKLGWDEGVDFASTNNPDVVVSFVGTIFISNIKSIIDCLADLLYQHLLQIYEMLYLVGASDISY